MFVKVCGITNFSDAEEAIACGATALGFIFAPSKRTISPANARNIIQKLPPHIDKVGVFTIADQLEIKRIADHAGLNVIQLHGPETLSTGSISALAGDFRLIQTIKIDADQIETLPPTDLPGIWKILLEPHIAGILGGAGKSFNWNILGKIDLTQVIIAGGLGPENIGELLKDYHPFGIDACSGLEESPGIKSAQKLKSWGQNINRFS